MKKIRIVILTLLCLISLSACSQSIDEAGKISREKADSFIENNFKEEVKGNKHLIFSVSDKNFLLIVEKGDVYEEYFVDTENKNRKKEKVIYRKADKILEKMFELSNYKREYITFDSDFFKPEYEMSSGNITYFVLKDENKKRYG